MARRRAERARRGDGGRDDRADGRRSPKDDGAGLLQARGADGLTDRERRFVEMFLSTNCPARSARALGFPREHARLQGVAMLGMPHVGAAIVAERERILKRYRTDSETLVAELAKVAHANVADYLVIDPDTGQARVDLSGVPHEALAALGEVKVEERVLVTSEPDAEDGTAGRKETHQVLSVKTTIKTRDKVVAIRDLLRLNGERVDPPGPEGARVAVAVIASTDPQEAARVYQRMLFGRAAEGPVVQAQVDQA